MHTAKQKNKKERKQKTKDPVGVKEHSQQQHSNHHQNTTPGSQKGSPKQCLQQGHCQVQPMKARPWAFTLKKNRESKTMPSARPLPGTANEGQTLSFHPEHHGSVLSTTGKQSARVAAPSCQGRCCKSPTPDTQEACA